jgi:hypothetical protein
VLVSINPEADVLAMASSENGCSLGNSLRQIYAPSMRGRRILTLVVVVGAVAAVSVTGVSLALAGGASSVSRHVPRALLRWAMSTAERSGDPAPFDVQAVRTTYPKAVEAMGSPYSWNGQPNDGTVFLVAMRGHFTAYDAPGPLGGRLPKGTVMAAILTRSLRVTDGYLGYRYPALARAGGVIRLK